MPHSSHAPVLHPRRRASRPAIVRAAAARLAALALALPSVFALNGSAADGSGAIAPPPLREGSRAAWVTPEVRAPRVSFHRFESAAAATEVSYHLYRPAAYEGEPDRRFPVVYWLHGSGGGAEGIPPLAARFDAAIASGAIPPVLVVFVNGLVNGMYVDWKDGSTPLERVIVEELLPHVDAAHRTIASREGRMLEGFSMGGYGAARLGFAHVERFGAISMLGAGPLQLDFADAPLAGPRQRETIFRRVYGGDDAYFRAVSPWMIAERRAEAIAARTLLRVVVGERDATFANNRAFHERLESLAIPHEWVVVAGVGHQAPALLEALGEDNWAFHRRAFGGAVDRSDAASIGAERAPEQATTAPEPRRARPPESALRFELQGRPRRAVVVNAPAEGTRPAVIALHGGMGSAEIMRRNARLDAVARREGFIVAYAEGAPLQRGGHAWNTGFLLRGEIPNVDDVAYLDGVIDALIRDHGADPERIFMTGVSNGGMMTFAYAVARPERIAAAAPVIASMFSFEEVPSVPVPILIVVGARDELVPIEGGMSRSELVRRAQAAPYKPIDEIAAFWRRANRSAAEPSVAVEGSVTTTIWPASEGGAPTVLVVDAEGGHGWPGSPVVPGRPAPFASFAGAERVWAFFASAPRRTQP